MKESTLVAIRIVLYTIWALAGAWNTAMAGVLWSGMGWEDQSCLVFGMILSWTGTMMAFFDKSVWKWDASKRVDPPPVSDAQRALTNEK